MIVEEFCKKHGYVPAIYYNNESELFTINPYFFNEINIQSEISAFEIADILDALDNEICLQKESKEAQS